MQSVEADALSKWRRQIDTKYSVFLEKRKSDRNKAKNITRIWPNLLKTMQGDTLKDTN